MSEEITFEIDEGPPAKKLFIFVVVQFLWILLLIFVVAYGGEITLWKALFFIIAAALPATFKSIRPPHNPAKFLVSPEKTIVIHKGKEFVLDKNNISKLTFIYYRIGNNYDIEYCENEELAFKIFPIRGSVWKIKKLIKTIEEKMGVKVTIK